MDPPRASRGKRQLEASLTKSAMDMEGNRPAKVARMRASPRSAAPEGEAAQNMAQVPLASKRKEVEAPPRAGPSSRRRLLPDEAVVSQTRRSTEPEPAVDSPPPRMSPSGSESLGGDLDPEYQHLSSESDDVEIESDDAYVDDPGPDSGSLESASTGRVSASARPGGGGSGTRREKTSSSSSTPLGGQLMVRMPPVDVNGAPARLTAEQMMHKLLVRMEKMEERVSSLAHDKKKPATRSGISAPTASLRTRPQHSPPSTKPSNAIIELLEARLSLSGVPSTADTDGFLMTPSKKTLGKWRKKAFKVRSQIRPLATGASKGREPHALC